MFSTLYKWTIKYLLYLLTLRMEIQWRQRVIAAHKDITWYRAFKACTCDFCVIFPPLDKANCLTRTLKMYMFLCRFKNLPQVLKATIIQYGVKALWNSFVRPFHALKVITKIYKSILTHFKRKASVRVNMEPCHTWFHSPSEPQDGCACWTLCYLNVLARSATEPNNLLQIAFIPTDLFCQICN